MDLVAVSVNCLVFFFWQKGRAEPDAAQAQSLTSDSYAVDGDAKYNAAAQDLVSKLPGVTTKNLRRLLNGVDDLAHLLSMSQVPLRSRFNFFFLTHQWFLVSFVGGRTI